MNVAHFPGIPQSVVRARRFVADSLPDVPGEIAETVTLITSELASNSVRHAATAFEVRVQRLPNEIHLEVEDDGNGEPTVRSPGPLDTSGRGLQIVRALADEWGVVPKPEAAGKTVWVRITLRTADDSVKASQSDAAHVPQTDNRTETKSSRRTGSSGSQTTLSLSSDDRGLLGIVPRPCHRTRHTPWSGEAPRRCSPARRSVRS